jgi:hypothetical protein
MLMEFPVTNVQVPYFLAHKTHPDFLLAILEKLLMYFNFSNLLEENRIVMYEN